MRNIASKALAIACATGTMGVPFANTIVSANEAEYTMSTENHDDMGSILEEVFSKKVGNMKFKKTENNSKETVTTYESGQYRIEVVGLDMEQTGDQNVTMYLTNKNAKASDQDKIVLSNEALQANNESTIVAADSGITIKHETVVNVEGIENELEESTEATQVSADKSAQIAAAALAQVGAYQDCTMLVTNSLAAVGINFHGWPEEYLALGEVTDQPVPGDIIVYSGHVAIYIGDGQAVHGGWLGSSTVVSTVECTNPLIGFVHVA